MDGNETKKKIPVLIYPCQQNRPPSLLGFVKDDLLAIGKPKVYLETRDGKSVSPEIHQCFSPREHIFKPMKVDTF
jgi:hypothetical protein